MTDNRNFGVSNETRNLTTNGRTTIPLAILPQTPVQRKGSLIFDPRILKLYYSDGVQWLEVISSSGGNLRCIEDDDGDTSVCTDDGTDPDIITFTTSSLERGRFSSSGVFMVGTTVPADGKVAHFEGDIKVTGVVDPTATQYEEVSDHPVDPTGTSTGVLWIRDDGPPNVLVFTDNDGTDYILNNVTLTSAGGTFSIVDDGTGPTLTNKGLTEGAGIAIVDGGTELTISSTIATPVWQEISGIISPITGSTNGLLCGDTSGGGTTNDITGAGSTDTVVAGGNSNIVTNCDDAGIFGGSGNTITGFSSAFPTSSSIIAGSENSAIAISHNAVILGGTDHLIVNPGSGEPDGNFIIGGALNSIPAATSCGIVGGLMNTMTSGAIGQSFLNTCLILCGTSNTINGGGGGQGQIFNSLIASSSGSTITKHSQAVILGGTGHSIIVPTTTASPNGNFILGGDTNDIISDGGGNSGIIGGTTHSITSSGQNNVMIGGNTSTISGTPFNTVTIGSTISATHSGNFIFGDGSAGGISTSATDGFTAKCSGGAIFWSDAGLTTGVSLAAGGASWAPISDKNKKENLVELSYTDILNRVENLPIYSYNFIGNPVQQKCMGPVAQDWHGPNGFPLDPIVEEVEDPENEGETITVQREAKDKLSIEIMDMLGVCLASIKALVDKNNQLQAQVVSLQSQNQLFESRLSKLENF